MKLALALAAAAVLSIGAMGGFVAWRHAHPGTYERELAWLESYDAWTDEIDAALAKGEDAPALRCERRLLALVGPAPNPGLAALNEAALSSCRSLRRWIMDAEPDVALPDEALDDWYATRYRVLGTSRRLSAIRSSGSSAAPMRQTSTPRATTSPKRS